MHIFYQSLLVIIICWSNTTFAINTSSMLKADNIYYDSKSDTIKANGNVSITMNGYVLNTESLKYKIKEDVVIAEEGVSITDAKGNKIQGEKVLFKDKLKQGLVEEFRAVLSQDSVIIAEKAKRLSEDRFELEQASFTPCTVYCGGEPIWQIKASKANIDNEKQRITYRNTFFEVYGYPVLYVPYFSHATPNADAQTGMLYPSIRNKDLMVPIYFRILQNMDFTFSPRFSKHYTIFDFEYRHLIRHGQYEIKGNFGNPSDSKLKSTVGSEETSSVNKNQRFHILAKGNFSSDKHLNFGFDINVASDKSYLVNYHNIYDPYLTSVLYARHTNARDYVSLEGIGFQELRNDNEVDKSFVAPLVTTRHSIVLNQDHSALFNMRSNSFLYNDSKDSLLAKSSLDFELAYNHIFDNGHVTDYVVGDRFNFYWRDLGSHITNENNSSSFVRNTPSLSFKWRYPLVQNFTNSTLQIEPVFKALVSKNLDHHGQKVNIIDAYNTELSENNIFNSDQLNIVNNDQDGLQVAYGANASYSHGHLYVSSFLGQNYYNKPVMDSKHFEYIGNVAVNVGETLDFFYRFRQDKDFRPIRNEFNLALQNERLKTQIGFAQLRNINEYFNNVMLPDNQNKISQLNFVTDAQIIRDLWVGGGFRVNLNAQSTRTISKTIRMTYLFDCVSMSFSMTDNFFQDRSRGVKKTRLPNFSLKLKVLNM